MGTPPLGLSSADLDKSFLSLALKENKEKLVEISDKGKKALVLDDQFNKERIWLLRQSVAKALYQSAKDFEKEGYILVVKDAYRSLEKQRQKYLDYLKKVRSQFPNLKLSEARKKADTFIAGIPMLAAHTAGAAVDIVLLDKNKKLVDMGCNYLSFGLKTITDSKKINSIQKHNRLVLKTVLEAHGFVNYPFEYWHYSIGDACATHFNKQKNIIFGSVGYDPIKKKTIFPHDKKPLYSYFK
jgi:zinc D-Ala-D-Ala dipeptidase